MVEISLSGSGEGPGKVTTRGYSTTARMTCSSSGTKRADRLSDWYQGPWTLSHRQSFASRNRIRRMPPRHETGGQHEVSYAARCNSTMGRCLRPET
jgi:hypothetical protein